jgi:hypothetical protein
MAAVLKPGAFAAAPWCVHEGPAPPLPPRLPPTVSTVSTVSTVAVSVLFLRFWLLGAALARGALSVLCAGLTTRGCLACVRAGATSGRPGS